MVPVGPSASTRSVPASSARARSPRPDPEPRAPNPDRRARQYHSPMPSTLLQKVWDLHTVRKLPNGQTQLFIGLHLIHEVTTPQAFDMLRARGLEGALPGAHDRHRRSHRPDPRSAAAVPRRDGRGHARGARAQLPRGGRPALRSEQRVAGHRPRHRAGAGAHAAGDDDRLRRQPHLDARRVRRGGVRHRHLAGARRARVAVPGDGSAEGAAHQRHRQARAGASTPRT